MKNTYEFEFLATCPVNLSKDCYACIVESGRLIKVEDILETAADRKDYQENITEEMARKLKARVTTVGFHSGVKTTCSAGNL